MVDEEVALARAWVQVSTCGRVANEQVRIKFWERILEHFKATIVGTTRSQHSLNTKWTAMNTSMGVFNGLYHNSVILLTFYDIYIVVNYFHSICY
jgi:hypothetical protein